MTPRELHIRGVEIPSDTVSSVREWAVDHTEAVRIVKCASGWRVFVKAQQFAPSKDTSRNTTNLREGFEVFANVRVSKREALKYLDEAFYARIREKANVRISTCGGCLFIG